MISQKIQLAKRRMPRSYFWWSCNGIFWRRMPFFLDFDRICFALNFAENSLKPVQMCSTFSNRFERLRKLCRTHKYPPHLRGVRGTNQGGIPSEAKFATRYKSGGGGIPSEAKFSFSLVFFGNFFLFFSAKKYSWGKVIEFSPKCVKI